MSEREKAKELFEKDGLIAYHYACYNVDWRNPTVQDELLISELGRLCFEEDIE